MFTTAAAQAAIGLLLANLPAVISTGEEVFSFVSAGITHLQAIFEKTAAPVTSADIQAALTKEALQAIQIAALK